MVMGKLCFDLPRAVVVSPGVVCSQGMVGSVQVLPVCWENQNFVNYCLGLDLCQAYYHYEVIAELSQFWCEVLC